jgi:serine/threonine protein kinase
MLDWILLLHLSILFKLFCRGFLPPEFINKQVISKEYDIFSLGAIIRRILTGVMDKDSIPDMDERESCELVRKVIFLHSTSVQLHLIRFI